jgi:hypothetical protein
MARRLVEVECRASDTKRSRLVWFIGKRERRDGAAGNDITSWLRSSKVRSEHDGNREVAISVAPLLFNSRDFRKEIFSALRG